MALDITPNDKNSLSVTNDSKPTSKTWDAATEIWNEATYTWDSPRIVLSKDTKNSLSIPNDNKN